MDREIGIGIVGCGSIARWKYAENLAVLPGASLRAFFGGRAEELRKAWGAPGAVTCGSLEELLGRSDVDAVCICTPNDSHAAITLAALRAGKHVLCEKPMAVDAASAEEMVRTAEESGVFLTVGHQARFYPSAQALHGELRAGRFGALYFARASMVRRMGIPTWGRFFDPVVQGGGCLMDLGTHALDLAMWLLDDFEPAYCSAGTFRGPGDMPTAANRWGPWDPAALKVETSAFGQVVMKNVHIAFAPDAQAGQAAMADGRPHVKKLAIYAENVKKIELHNVRIEGYEGERLQFANVGSFEED